MIENKNTGNTSLRLFALLVLLTIGFLVFKDNYLKPCTRTIKYSLGSIDPKFQISDQQFLNTIKSAETIWEEKINKNLFEYNPESKFKINLIYDERQQKTIDEQNLRSQIENQNLDYEELVKKYETLTTNYNERLNKYNEDVNYYNKRGGADELKYKELQNELKDLENLYIQITNLTEIINRIVDEQNLKVEKYNNKYTNITTFDQGEYKYSFNKKEINIYQFSDLEDLLLVTTHELGHTLGIEHTEDPKSIMYYLMDQQERENIDLTEEDTEALVEVCN